MYKRFRRFIRRSANQSARYYTIDHSLKGRLKRKIRRLLFMHPHAPQPKAWISIADNFFTRLDALLQRLKDKYLNRATTKVQVVYARLSPTSSNPIVAVCSNEEEVYDLRHKLLKKWPELEITWSDEVVQDAPLNVDGTVHFVTQCGMLDPVVVGAFVSKESAEQLREDMDPGPPCKKNYMLVRSLPIGWRAPGQPWLEVEDE